MHHIHPITTIEDPLLLPYRTMTQQEDHRQERIFVAEGEKVVRRLLESKLPVLSVLMPRAMIERFAPLLESRTEQIEAFVAEKSELIKLTGFTIYLGILA